MCDRYHWDEAEPLLRHGLGVLRREPIPDHATLADALETMGYSFAARDKGDQAEPFVTQALTHARAAWGEQSSGYANILNELAGVKLAERDDAGAEAIYRQVVALQDRLAPGGEHSIAPLVNLCISLFNQEKLADTRRMLDRLERDARRLLGENSVYFACAIYGYGLVDAAEGNYQAAIPLLRDALPALGAVYPPGQTTVVQCRAELGLCLTRTGQAAEGEPLLRAALADGSQVDRGDFAHTIGNLQTALGECLLAQKRYSEAEPLLLTGHDDLERRLGPQNRLTLQATHRLHDLYLAWKKPEQAVRFAVDEISSPTPTP